MRLLRHREAGRTRGRSSRSCDDNLPRYRTARHRDHNLGVGIYGERGRRDAAKRNLRRLGEADTDNGHYRSHRPARGSEAGDLRGHAELLVAGQYALLNCHGHIASGCTRRNDGRHVRRGRNRERRKLAIETDRGRAGE